MLRSTVCVALIDAATCFAQVQQFLSAIDRSGGVYTHRWGDAPIQSAAIELFARPSTVARLPTDYLHVSTMNRIFRDGTEVDGWFDHEMQQHPITRAHQRQLLEASSVNFSASCVNSSRMNGSRANASTDCDAGAQQLARPVLHLSFPTTERWSFFTSSVLHDVAAAFSAVFFVDQSRVVVRNALVSTGVNNEVQVRSALNHYTPPEE
eukprot:1140418-Prymnesium_polylepis.3